jgi:hypothetical protein
MARQAVNHQVAKNILNFAAILPLPNRIAMPHTKLTEHPDAERHHDYDLHRVGRRSYKMSSPIAEFSRVVGAALLSRLLLLSRKGRQPSTSPSLVTGAERKNMSQIFFSPKETRLFPEGSEDVAIDLVD